MRRGEGRPTNGYYKADGTRVPSVTTINSFGGDSGGLVYKAKKNWHEAGRLGYPFTRDDYWPDDPQFWGDAKETGSIVHQWIEDDIHGDPLTRFDDTPAIQLSEATRAYEAFRNWWTDVVNLEVVATELPLVSEEYGFGGTLDAIAITTSGRRVLLDWKASNSARVSYIAQLGAYRQLVNENNYGPVSAGYLLRVGKAHGDFHFHYYPEEVLDDGWEWFLHAKGQMELEKRLKKVAS